jgi:hypothetical protein
MRSGHGQVLECLDNEACAHKHTGCLFLASWSRYVKQVALRSVLAPDSPQVLLLPPDAVAGATSAKPTQLCLSSSGSCIAVAFKDVPAPGYDT